MNETRGWQFLLPKGKGEQVVLRFHGPDYCLDY